MNENNDSDSKKNQASIEVKGHHKLSPVLIGGLFAVMAAIVGSLIALVPFFLEKGGESSTPPVKAARIYVHASGSFEKQGDMWVEYPEYAPGEHYEFKELRRDNEYIYLYDETRRKDPGRVMHLRIPIAGGIAQWSYPNPIQWIDFCAVEPKF